MTKEFPLLIEAIRSLGATNDERARKLGKSRRMIEYYLSGQQLPSLRVVASHPSLVQAFCRDTVTAQKEAA